MRTNDPGEPPFERWLGRSVTLCIRRFGAAGAFLSEPSDHEGPEDPSILLLGSEIPDGAAVGDRLEVFVYLDSRDRPIATTRKPKLSLGEVAFLKVTAVTEIGAFVDWGLAKELLVPFAEQTRPLRVGERHPIGLYLDDSGRLAGTQRVSEMLDRRRPSFRLDQWVEGEAWRNDPDIGLFVIVDRAFAGLVPASEPHSLARGDAARFRVTHVQRDGKFELSLRGHAHEELDRDARHVLEVLLRPGTPRVSDRSDPEELRVLFGLSKKAFKRAVGRLLKQGAVSMDRDDHVVPKARP